MASFNQWLGLGNLTREPEMKHLQSGLAVCEFGIAVNEKRKDKPDEVLFIDVTCFNKTAEIAAEYLHKGSQILLNGKLKFEQWEADGQKRSKHRIICNDFQMLGAPKGERFSQAGKTVDEYAQAPAKPADDSEIPF